MVSTKSGFFYTNGSYKTEEPASTDEFFCDPKIIQTAIRVCQQVSVFFGGRPKRVHVVLMKKIMEEHTCVRKGRGREERKGTTGNEKQKRKRRGRGNEEQRKRKGSGKKMERKRKERGHEEQRGKGIGAVSLIVVRAYFLNQWYGIAVRYRKGCETQSLDFNPQTYPASLILGWLNHK